MYGAVAGLVREPFSFDRNTCNIVRSGTLDFLTEHSSEQVMTPILSHTHMNTDCCCCIGLLLPYYSIMLTNSVLVLSTTPVSNKMS